MQTGRISDKRWLNTAVSLLCLVGLMLGILLVRLPLSPRYVGLGDDGALFAYFGEEILDGSILYEDVWDTKPPGVFYLNALAIWLGGATPWAIWILELAWLILATAVLLFVLYRISGFLPALAATVLVTFTALHPLYIRGGNLTEVYAYLPQILVVAAAIGYFSSGRSSWLALAGLLTGLAFMMKPTYVALGISTLLIAVLASSNARARQRAAAFFLTGFALPILIAAAYWGMQAALDDLVSAVFLENVQYVQAGLSVRSLYGTTRKLLLEQPLATLIVFSIASAVLFFDIRKPLQIRRWASPGKANETDANGNRDWVLLVAFLALPLELALVAVSGRNFGHYFITPLPAVAVACSFLFAQIQSTIRNREPTGSWFWIVLVLMVGILAAWFLEVFAEERPSVEQVKDFLREGVGAEILIDDVEAFVINHTDPEDSVLTWGYNPGLHFVTRRKAPSPYLFHSQLVSPGTESSTRFDRLLNAIVADPPALVLAQKVSQHAVPFFGQPELCISCSEKARANLQRLNNFVEGNYVLRDEIDDWLIYDHQGGLD